jgi:pSer/pThr/pTyr-binding forkhead associated (FHA) protein
VPEIVYITLRYVFLGLLYLFVFLVARLMYRELRPAPSGRPVSPPRKERMGRKPTLVALDQRGRRTRLNAFLGDQVVLGRGPECGVELKDEFASTMHAKIYQSEGRYYVEDLGSTNGTYVNGRRINSPTELRSGDTIKIGRTEMEFRR